MQENMSLARKCVIWLTGICGLLGYTLDSIGQSAFKYLNIDFRDFAASTEALLRPYSFILVVTSVIFWFTPHKASKRLILGTFFLIALAAMIFDLQYNFTTNFKALSLIMLGLATMLTLPKLELWKKVFIGFLIGILLGFDLKAAGLFDFSEYLKIIGQTFIDLIMMIVVPLIFFALVSGINSMTDNALGRVGFKAVAIYMLSALLAVGLGLIMASIFNPGEGVKDLTAATKGKDFVLSPLLKLLLDMIPHNAIGAMAGAEGKPHIVQVVFIAIFVGVTLNVMGEQGKRVVEFCNSSAQLMFKMIGFIIKLAPIAVFSLMAWMTTNLGVDAIIQLLKLVACTIGGMAVHLVILALMLTLLGRLNPWHFFVKSREYQMLAFSTSSSKATLAVAMRIAEEKIGVSRASTSFVLPLGAAINMDGTAIYLGICAVFFAQVFGVHLEVHHYILIVFACTIASIGAAGYPGGSLVMLPMVLSTIGLSKDNIDLGIALIAGVDRILDMFRTMINVTSDVALTTIIDRTEGTFNVDLYNTPIDQIEGVENDTDYAAMAAKAH